MVSVVKRRALSSAQVKPKVVGNKNLDREGEGRGTESAEWDSSNDTKFGRTGNR